MFDAQRAVLLILGRNTLSTALTIILFCIGILLIVKGGDYFVDAASWIARASGIPKFIIGATIVSFATTLPELIVSLIAAAEGKVDMAAGNAIGSVTANLGLIMGISIIWLPSVMSRKKFAFKSILMAVACTLLFIFSYGNELTLASSIILLFVFAVFLWENVSEARKSISSTYTAEKIRPTKKEVVVNLLKFAGGTAGIIIGAQLLVDNGSEIARLLGVPEGIIAVTIVAVGTSLPELVTTISALVKKQASLSIGNIIGANIIDLTIILPLCAIVSGGSLPVSHQTAMLDLPVCLITVLIAIVPALISQKFRRSQGLIILGVYVAYLVFLTSGLF